MKSFKTKPLQNYKPSPLAGWLTLAIFMWVAIVFMWIFWNFWSQYQMFVEMLWLFYIWYSISFWGILIGLLRALLDWFCTGFILIWVYNIIYKSVKNK